MRRCSEPCLCPPDAPAVGLPSYMERRAHPDAGDLEAIRLITGWIRSGGPVMYLRFADGEFCLYLFYEPDGSLFGFQLVFAQGKTLLMVSWTPVEEYRSAGIHDDSGGSDHWDYGLVPDHDVEEPIDIPRLVSRLKAAAAALEPPARAFVLNKLRRYRQAQRRCRFCIKQRPGVWRCRRCRGCACKDCFQAKNLRASPCREAERGPWDGPHEWSPVAK